MKKGISFERIVVAFVIILIIIFLINALDPASKKVFSECDLPTSKDQTHYRELKTNSNNALPINVTIFIDPSSRIDKPGVIERDTCIIRETISQFLCRTFGTNLKTIKKHGNYLKVMSHPFGNVDQEVITNYNRTINDYSAYPHYQSLWNRIINQIPNIEPAEYSMDSIKRDLLENKNLNLTKYYLQLGQGKDQKGNRLGSDIYGFIADDLQKDNVIRGGCRNILFILTDGWMDYRLTRKNYDNSKSEIYYISNEDSLRKKRDLYQNNLQFKNPHDFRNDSLEIYVFGLSNSNDPYHENKDLHKLWEDWLLRMVGKGRCSVFDFNKGYNFQDDIFKILNPLTEKNSK